MRRQILRITLLLFSPGLVSGCGGRAPFPPVRKPNVLLIAVDDLTVRLGCYGYDVKTPNIDRLAGRGRRFDRAYRQYPMGGPSRASLMTGWRPERTRVFGAVEPLRDRLPGAVPLEEHFKASGYFTARVGTIYGGTVDREFAWDAAEDSPGPSAAEGGGRTADRAAQLVAEHRGGPFFIAAGFDRPDPRWLPPAAYLALYDAGRIRLPEPPADDWEDLPPLAMADGDPASFVRPIRKPVPEEQRRRAMAAYYAYVSFVDFQVGMLLDTLDRLELWDRTIVVLVGDDGAELGVHGALPRKDMLFEESLRSPLIITAPGGRRPGAATDRLVELVDVYPTLVELCGLPRVSGIEGASLAPLLEDPGHAVKTAAFSVVRRAAGPLGRSVRTDRYRYTEWPDGSRELYDHQVDPSEHTNLAKAHEQAPALEAMRSRLRDRVTGSRPGLARSPGVARARPNVLFVVVDDLNVRLGCYGYDVRTPNIDRLARRGRRFDRAYCQYPSCSPSRTSLMTGWRPEKTGVLDNTQSPREHLEGALPLQEHFHANGYFTARVGKVYHGPFEDQFRWDVAEHTPHPPEAEDGEDEPSPAKRPGLGRRGGLAGWWTATDNKDEDEPDGRTARRVAQLIEQHRGRPFFIAAGFNKPHLRWVAPRKYFDMYPPERILLPPAPEDDWKDIPRIAISRRAPRRPGALLEGRQEPEDLRRRAIASYYACVSFVDAQVGVLLDTLDRLKLWDRTIVVLLGDHGFHLGEHTGLWQKNTLFEESLRVPLLIAAPGFQQQGAATRELAEFVDVYPSLVELAGLPEVTGLEGVSLVPILEDPGRSVKGAAFSVVSRVAPELGRSVRTERYRYTEWPDGSDELYDHQADPQEYANRADDPKNAQTVEEMRRRLEEGYRRARVPR